MGYVLHAFIIKRSNFELFRSAFNKVIVIDLDQELSLIPMTEDLFDQINGNQCSNSINSFVYLTRSIEKEVLQILKDCKFAYVEADYFGGIGSQSAICWVNGKRVMCFESNSDAINLVLGSLGVSCHGGQDEFATIGLARHRRTEDWIEEL